MTETVAEKLTSDGIDLTDRELRTIIRLFRSRRFKRFLKKKRRGEIINDANCCMLMIFDANDRVCLYTELFDFITRERLPRNRFHRGAWWWTRGLRHIYERMRDMA